MKKTINRIMSIVGGIAPAVVLTLGVGCMMWSCDEDVPDVNPDEPTEMPDGGEDNPPEGENPAPDDPSSPTIKSKDIVLSTGEKVIAEAMISGAFRQFRLQNGIERASKNPADNLMMSPLSLSCALSMIANGSVGETRTEILRGLGLESNTLDELNEFYKKLASELASLDADSKFNVANSIWYRNDIKPLVRTTYIDCMMENYSAPTEFVSSFESQATIERINDWCDDNSDGFIKRLFDVPMSDDTYSLLLNLLYFKGTWALPFDSAKTAEGVFLNEDGTSSTVMMMERELCGYDAIWNKSYSAVRMPYGNEAFSMIVVRPENGIGVDECIELLEKDYDALAALSKGETETGYNLAVHMPRLELEYKWNLASLLNEGMGITRVFSQELADLSEMYDLGDSKVKLRFDAGVQMCKLAVDEHGTEGGAATFFPTAVGPEGDADYRINRPFVFIISERSTGLPIFMGRVTRL